MDLIIALRLAYPYSTNKSPVAIILRNQGA